MSVILGNDNEPYILRFCVNCANHRIKEFEINVSTAKIGQFFGHNLPEKLPCVEHLCVAVGRRNLVTGEKWSREFTCEEMREDEDLCGRKAMYYRSKEQAE